MKHWTKNNKMILRAVREDEAPVSLLALELRGIKHMTLKESIEQAQALVLRAVKTLK